MADEKSPQYSGGSNGVKDSRNRPPSFRSSVDGSSAPPPEYTERDLSRTMAQLNLSLNDAPTPDQCIAHLKLLEAFHRLHQDISKTDGLFGIHDNLAASDKTKRYEEELVKVYEKRWAVYVTRAAGRFESWWAACVPERLNGRPGRRLRQLDMVATDGRYFETLPRSGVPLEFTADNLPPIDVLMVWHSYMLNPRGFFEDCVRLGKVDFWVTGMPWAAITPLIDDVTFIYKPSVRAESWFESKTHLAWDNINDPSTKVVICPICRANNDVPWTSCSDAEIHQDVGSYFTQGIGYAEKDFCHICNKCEATLRHELLRVQKFKRDAQRLLIDDNPMPGTILSINGLAGRVHGSQPWHVGQDIFFPNRMIMVALKHDILSLADTKQAADVVSMNGVKSLVEATIKDIPTLHRINGKYSLLRKPARIAVRRMMSRYWTNSSAFALDLVGAVIRQGSFIEKMHGIDWYHSPTVGSTMKRIVGKYHRFFQIMKANPGKIAVPTLDVDLAWHTHQLSPSLYYAYSVLMTGVFIDHDDKIDEVQLSDSFEWTSKTYQKMFNEVYSECTCWYCESIRASHDSGLLGVRSSKAVTRSLDDGHFTDDVRSSPHISAHNAVRTDYFDHAKHARELDAAYEKACKRARKRGKKEPERSQYMHYWYYGQYYPYPIYMPMYYPFMADPYTTGTMYPADPACMTQTAGAAGNCAAGTCAGAVASGGCAGIGGAACGGSGGCGGGGGGCGGSGGGCGGGGGGCGGGGS